MTFEDLEAWQQARRLVNSIYALTRTRELAKDFRLCSQMQSAAVSIMSNVAEGFERTHLPEKIQFYNVAARLGGRSTPFFFTFAEDNFRAVSGEARRVRAETNEAGKLITGMLGSTIRRRESATGVILALFSPISFLLSSSFFHLR